MKLFFRTPNLKRKIRLAGLHLRILISLLICTLCLGFGHNLYAQDQITIGDDGIMRWTHDSSEVTGFGVNYTVPFAYAYRTGKKMGVDLKAAIDQDVYQFARLGFDLFRVHVWDCEISDTLGNLLNNEHLDLFDYLLAQLKKHHINAIITPIAYWGNGWPEKDEDTPGFSHKYGKAQCLVNPDAIRAQVNYLHQFVNHVNPYLGKAYREEPMILAFEICNEPHHEGAPEEVTAFIKRMKDAIRQTGCTKPVFYNVSHKIHLAEAYCAAGIDGGTFQWYPTGLTFQKEEGGNMLPNVDRYTIPFDTVLKKNHLARIVYEFDAADMAKNYLYPAMARSFRTAGIQLATQFAWDPTFTAPYNTEYNTHFMNLLYAPQKALSLMICGEIFHTLPLYTDYGVYPDNTTFGPFHVSYEDNLAEMVSDEKFIYTNNTDSRPPHPEKLELIAGWGNSPLVEYEGTGAYFLDKVGDQIWRLEVMPDAVQVNNLFGRNSLDKVVAVVKQERRKMKFNLPGFEDGFSVESVDWRDSIIYRETKDKTVALKPGVYLLMGWKYIQDDSLLLEAKKPIELENFLPYPPSPDSIFIVHDYLEKWYPGINHLIEATIVAPVEPKKVILHYFNCPLNDYKRFPMIKTGTYTYKALVPGKFIHKGEMLYEYYFELAYDSTFYYAPWNKTFTSPQGELLQLGMGIAATESNKPFYLFTATDMVRSNLKWIPSLRDEKSYDTLLPELPPIRRNVHIQLDSIGQWDNENLHGPIIHDYTIRHYFGDMIKGHEKVIANDKVLVLNANAAEYTHCPVQVTLVQKNGQGFGYTFDVNDYDTAYYVLLDDLEPVPVVLMPRPFPSFLPYYSAVQQGTALDLTQIESVEISIGPGIPKADLRKQVDVFIKNVWIE